MPWCHTRRRATTPGWPTLPAFLAVPGRINRPRLVARWLFRCRPAVAASIATPAAAHSLILGDGGFNDEAANRACHRRAYGGSPSRGWLFNNGIYGTIRMQTKNATTLSAFLARTLGKIRIFVKMARVPGCPCGTGPPKTRRFRRAPLLAPVDSGRPALIELVTDPGGKSRPATTNHQAARCARQKGRRRPALKSQLKGMTEIGLTRTVRTRRA